MCLRVTFAVLTPLWLSLCSNSFLATSTLLLRGKRPSGYRAVSVPLGGDKVLRVHLVTGRPIKRPSLSALERIRLNLDPGLKPHFPCSLDVYSQPVTTHHFQATSVLLIAVTE